MLALPALDRPLRRWRKFDPAARAGMPAHLTLVFPFIDSRSVDEAVRVRLRDALMAYGPFEMVFDRLGAFPGGVWLEPADPAPALRLIAALAGAFPEHPPYGGAFERVIAHATIAQGPPELLARIRREAPARLPLTARAEAVSLYARFADGWVPIERFALTGRG